MSPERAACLITAVHTMDPTTTFHDTAHSVELRLSPARVLQLASVDQICAQREQQGVGSCTIQIGHHQHPTDTDIDVYQGIGIQIRIPPTLTDQEAEQNLCRRVRQRRLQGAGHSWNSPTTTGDDITIPEEDHPRPASSSTPDNAPEDEVSFMGKRPKPSHSRAPIEVSSTSSTPSSTMSSSDWRRTVIFTMDSTSTSAMLPWHDQDALFEHLAITLDTSKNEILRVIAVLQRPQDYVQVDLHCLLLQKRTEFRPTPFVRLVLVDRELHIAQGVQPTPFRRFVAWVPYITTRFGLLQELGMGTLCHDQEQLCHVWRNNLALDRQSNLDIHISDGDYIKIFAGELENPETCLSDLEIDINDTEGSLHDEEESEESELFQTAMCQLQHDCSRALQTLKPDMYKTAPSHVTTVNLLGDTPSNGRADPPERPSQDFHRGDLERFISLFEREALIECSDEGLIAYVDTWYIHHQRQGLCRDARPIRLGADPNQWKQEVLALWEDTIDPMIATTIHLVRPSPPCAMTECVLAHLILEQSQRPEHGVGLITVYTATARGDSTQHVAHSLPNIMTAQMVLRTAEMHLVCQSRLCSITLGDLPFAMHDWEEVPRAAGLVIKIRPLLLFQADEDHTDFMQRTSTRWRRAQLPSDGLNSSSSVHRCTQGDFQFNPAAPAFDPAVPNIHILSEEVQELHQHWLRTAFSWQGETASASIQTWFVDHHNQNFWTCVQPRSVRLYEDFSQWEAQIRHAWRDFLDPASHSIIQVVTPTPPNNDAETAAHVLLIQRPHDVFATILTTVLDVTQPAGTLTMQIAITTHEHMHLQNLVFALGLAGRCIMTGSPMICHAWYGNYYIRMGVAFPARNGQSIILQMQPRPTFQNQQGGHALLQLRATRLRRERQTHGLVAHTHGPRQANDQDLPCEESPPEEDLVGQGTVIVYVHWPPTFRSASQLPTFVEVEAPGYPIAVQRELRCWGYEGEAYQCGQHDAVYFNPRVYHGQQMHIYCNQDVTQPNGIHVQHGPAAEDDLVHMKVLSKKGYRKAVIVERDIVTSCIVMLHFRNVEPQHDPGPQMDRTPTPWPQKQPLQVNMTLPYSTPKAERPETDFLLAFDCDELHRFFTAKPLQMIQDITPYDVPEFIQQAVQKCKPLDRHDRIVIYTDGSSQSRRRHQSPLWTDLHDVSDAWCLAVFAEKYDTTETVEEPQLEFIGLTCQQILYEVDRPHHAGTDHIGSDAAETEALLWSALWRLAQNHRIPTVFISDSQLAGGQAAGRVGAAHPTAPFQHLRAAFQALEAILPEDHLRIAHTRSHAGEPFNELVDFFAKLEAKSSLYLPRQQLDLQTFGSTLRILWMILSQDRDLPDLCDGGLALLPPDLPPNTTEPAQRCSRSTASKIDISLSFATANVRTFYRGEEGVPGKLSYVRGQFRQMHLHFLGLQETRTSPCTSITEEVLRLAGGDCQGQHGVELWINLAQPYGWCRGKPQYLARSHVVVTHADPRYIIVHVQNDHLDFWIAVIYAPQSGIPLSEREKWWHNLTTLLHAVVGESDLVLLADANAASGRNDGCHVFQNDDSTTSGTSCLRELLSTQNLCLPATSHCHQGEHETWVCPATGRGHRIDYVAIPVSWFPSCTLSRTIPDLDLGNAGDHTAVGLEVQWRCFTQYTPSQRPSTRFYDRGDVLRSNLQDLLLDYKPPAWSTDIATQVEHCNKHLQHVMSSSFPQRQQGPKKPFITDEIWQLRTQKLRAGRQLRQLRRIQVRELLAQTFILWKGSSKERPGAAFHVSVRCAQLKHGVYYQLTNAELRQSLRRARKLALQQAIEEIPEDAHAGLILQTLKPLVGPTNIKHKRVSPLPIVHDSDGRPCQTPQELIDRWANFFGAMEGGTRMDQTDLWNIWRKNLENFMPQSLHLRPEDVPTLVDLERAYRRVCAGKAIGADDVPPELCHGHPAALARLTYTQMLKLVAHGQEALIHKGGLLVSAWKKKGAQHDCSSYRSLLISSHVGKTLHRALRETQSSIYEQFLQKSQIGGRKRVPVGLGVHHVRASLRRAKQNHASSALIFLDLQEAFYRVLRPLAVGGSISDDILGQIACRLHLDQHVLHDLHDLMSLPAATQLAGLPNHLQTALLALHTDTHFWVAGQTDCIRTAVGTRPGDPFADVVFGYMFARILKNVEAQMIEADLIEVFLSAPTAGLFPSAQEQEAQLYMGPTWMDDLCITLSAASANAIESKAGIACGILLDVCCSHGVTPNLQKGKSEILFAFRGRGARAQRQKYFGPHSTGKMNVLTEGTTQEISVVGQYQHLGGIVHHSGETRQEMRKRIAQGHAAFNLHRKTLFQNPSLSQAKRGELFQTLVVSKITYGTESWTLMDKANKHFFHSAYMRLYRRVLKLPHDQQITDEELMTQLRLPSPSTVLRVARLRYLALLYKCEEVTPWAVIREDTAWKILIENDLQWLWSLVRSTTRLPDPQESFGAWENVLRYHRTYWKRILQRAVRLEILHVEDQLLLQRLHQAAFQFLEELSPFIYRPQIFQPAPEQAEEVFGCMQCCKRFRSHGGEGAHLCRSHGIVAPIRWHYADTTCPACLKAYHTFDKLQQHLRHNRSCRQLVQGNRRHSVPAPGMGSIQNQALIQQHDGLAPPTQAQGPHDERRRPQMDELYHWDLYESIVTACFDQQDHPDRDLFTYLQEKIMEHAIGWTQTKQTLCYILNNLTEEDAMLAHLDLTYWQLLLQRLGDYRQWSFLREDIAEEATAHNLKLEHYEQWCQELCTHDQPRVPRDHIPRVHFQERVIVHAYSGRRRHGDFQWFLEKIAEKKELNLLYVVSLDLVIDPEWGDIGRPETYSFWTHAIRSGYVQGVLGGPPCCTWSAARGKVDHSMMRQGRTGPRPIRSAQELWGFWSLSLKEKRQILDGHRLLAFSLLCMILLDQVDGAGILEHPSEPADPDSPSIWKLPLIDLLLKLPGFEKIVFAQGLLGADSAKGTSLLVLNLPGLPLELRRHAISAELPRGRSIGLDAQGNFKTSVLKEYPPALCSALATSFADFLHDRNFSQVTERHSLPADVKTRLTKMVSHNFGTSIGPDCVK